MWSPIAFSDMRRNVFAARKMWSSLKRMKECWIKTHFSKERKKKNERVADLNDLFLITLFQSHVFQHFSFFFFFYLCSYMPIVDYIDTQFENYLQEELKIKRSLFNYHDTRIHICLYFIAPTGHSLKSLDLVTMKKLDSKVHTADDLRGLLRFNYKSRNGLQGQANGQRMEKFTYPCVKYRIFCK